MQLNAVELTSWADVVRGEPVQSEDRVQFEAALVPGRRAFGRVLCIGELLVMLEHHGWIKSLQAIDHPDVNRHAGRIYLNRGDLRRGAVLTPGCTVSFYLYADERGLGADDCHLVADSKKIKRLTALNHCSPGLRTPLRTSTHMWKASTPMQAWQHSSHTIVPGRHGMVTLVPLDAVSQWLDAASDPIAATTVHTQSMPDSEDSDDEEAVPLGTWSALAARCSRAISDASWAETSCAGVNVGKLRANSRGSDVSTNTGDSSDSDSVCNLPEAPPGLMALAKAGDIAVHKVMPPPGLEQFGPTATLSAVHAQPLPNTGHSDEEEGQQPGVWSTFGLRLSRAIGDAARADKLCASINGGKFRTDSQCSNFSSSTADSSNSDFLRLAPAPPMAHTIHKVMPPPGLELIIPSGVA